MSDEEDVLTVRDVLAGLLKLAEAVQGMQDWSMPASVARRRGM